jgi:hypothetical protein
MCNTEVNPVILDSLARLMVLPTTRKANGWHVLLRTLAFRSLSSFARRSYSSSLISRHSIVSTIFHTVASSIPKGCLDLLNSKVELGHSMRLATDLAYSWETLLPASFVSYLPHSIGMPLCWTCNNGKRLTNTPRLLMVEHPTEEYSNAPIPTQLSYYYFELQAIYELSPPGRRLALGISTKTGDDALIYGISIDGAVYANGHEVRGEVSTYGPVMSGIVWGFLWIRDKRTLHVTRNGKLLDDFEILIPETAASEPYYVCVKSLSARASTCCIVANFGQDAFQFDMDQYLREQMGIELVDTSPTIATTTTTTTTNTTPSTPTPSTSEQNDTEPPVPPTSRTVFSIANTLTASLLDTHALGIANSSDGGEAKDTGAAASIASTIPSAAAISRRLTRYSNTTKETSKKAIGKLHKALARIVKVLPAHMTHYPVGYEFNLSAPDLRTAACLSSKNLEQLVSGFGAPRLRGLVIASNDSKRLVRLSNGESGLSMCLWLPESMLLSKGVRCYSIPSHGHLNATAKKCLHLNFHQLANRCSLRLLEHWATDSLAIDKTRFDFVSSGDQLLGLVIGLCSSKGSGTASVTKIAPLNADGNGDDESFSSTTATGIAGNLHQAARALVPNLFVSLLTSRLALELLDSCAERNFHFGNSNAQSLTWVVLQCLPYVDASDRGEFCSKLLRHLGNVVMRANDVTASNKPPASTKDELVALVIATLQRCQLDNSDLSGVVLKRSTFEALLQECSKECSKESGESGTRNMVFSELLLLLNRMGLVARKSDFDSVTNWSIVPEKLMAIDALGMVHHVCSTLLEKRRFAPWLVFQALREQRGLQRYVVTEHNNGAAKGSLHIDGANDMTIMLESSSGTSNQSLAFSLINEEDEPISNMFESSQFLIPSDTVFFQAEAPDRPDTCTFWVIPNYSAAANRLLLAEPLEPASDASEHERAQEAARIATRTELVRETLARCETEYSMELLYEAAQLMKEQIEQHQQQYAPLLPLTDRQKRHFSAVAALPEAARQLLVLQLMNLNILISNALRFISMMTLPPQDVGVAHGSAGSNPVRVPDDTMQRAHRQPPTAQCVSELCGLLLPCFKEQYTRHSLPERECSEPTVTIDRLPGLKDASIFDQVRQQLLHLSAPDFRTGGKLFTVKLAGEGAVDGGGPFREIMSELCHEVQSTTESDGLFIACPNAKTGLGRNRDKYIPNPACTSPDDLRRYRFVGCLMGYSFYNAGSFPMPFNLPPLVWKQLLGMPLTLSDLIDIDQRCSALRHLDDPYCSDETLLTALEVADSFVATLSNGTLVELKPGGRHIGVLDHNRVEFLQLYTHARLNESRQQLAALRQGFTSVIPAHVLTLFSVSELEELICGKAEIDLDLLKSYTTDNLPPEASAMFWQVLESFDHKERVMFIRFASGWERLSEAALKNRRMQLTQSRSPCMSCRRAPLTVDVFDSP